ncbi:MAG: AtpZ/AtpI family protein [Sphingomonadales bacterium]|nr:AtpZ/AtpI family protein [Sphingomonadales bacterium]MDE2568748.1 AtpZ/AtpI family protein [Sphingomonadales bacterium]
MERRRRDPGPPVGAWLGQVGVLGWITITPLLIGLAGGRWLDWWLGTGLLLTPPLVLLGAVLGFWSAWKWMKRRL